MEVHPEAMEEQKVLLVAEALQQEVCLEVLAQEVCLEVLTQEVYLEALEGALLVLQR